MTWVCPLTGVLEYITVRCNRYGEGTKSTFTGTWLDLMAHMVEMAKTARNPAVADSIRTRDPEGMIYQRSFSLDYHPISGWCPSGLPWPADFTAYEREEYKRKSHHVPQDHYEPTTSGSSQQPHTQG